MATAVAQQLEARAPASVYVQPFQALELNARPPVASGRRRALFYADVRNVGNAPVAVDVEGVRARGPLPRRGAFHARRHRPGPDGRDPDRRPAAEAAHHRAQGRPPARAARVDGRRRRARPGRIGVGDLPPAPLDPVVGGTPRPAARDRGAPGVPALAGSRDRARRPRHAQRVRGPGAARGGRAHGVARLEERGAPRRRAREPSSTRRPLRATEVDPGSHGHAAARPRRPQDPRAGRQRAQLRRGRPAPRRSPPHARERRSAARSRREPSRARSRRPAA